MKLTNSLLHSLAIGTLTLGCAVLAGCSGNDPMAPKITPEPILSSFTTGLEGWTALGDYADLRTSGLLRPGIRGISGDFLTTHDRAEGTTFYFRASNRYRGDLEGYYGGNLSYWLRVGAGVNALAGFKDGERFTDYDVMIEGGGLTLGYVLPPDKTPEASAWSYFTIPLRAESWITIGERSRRRATEEQLRTALSDVHDLRIRGEYIVGVDWGAIDEVRLSAAE